MTLVPNSKMDMPARATAIPLHQDASGSALSGHRWLHRFRVQLPALMVTTLLAQLLAHFVFLGYVTLASPVSESLLAAQITNIAGALSFKAVQRVPGTRKLAFILPTVTASYGILVLATFVLRIP